MNKISQTIMENISEVDTKFWPAHRESVKSHLLQSQIKVIEAVIEKLEQSKKDGKHRFDVGFQTCRYCGEPRILFDRVRVVLKIDEKSGGELATVTEKRYDQTEFPCSKNPMPTYNQALEDQISSLNQVKESIQEALNK